MLIVNALKTIAIAASIITISAHAGTVAVSNYPLRLLSDAITQGEHDAKVLLEKGDVGHHGSLSPSALKTVHEADFVVWFGAPLETNIADTLQNAPNAIALLDMNAFYRLPMRDVDGQVRENSEDVHLWLHPTNAKAIVAALTVVHSHANPSSASKYQQNAQDFYQKMDALVDAHKSNRHTPYWAYHDAYQYIEQTLSLEFMGALTPDHHLAPKASRFKILQQNRPKQVMCIASQTKVSDGIQHKLAPVNVVVRQEDMSDSTSFLQAWGDLADDLVKCSA